MATNHTLFPDIRTPEQIARYQSVLAILDGYRQDRVTMKQVLDIPKVDLEEAREWISELSFASLEADIPEIWEGIDG